VRFFLPPQAESDGRAFTVPPSVRHDIRIPKRSFASSILKKLFEIL
jgi:hypothetical protein